MTFPNVKFGNVIFCYTFALEIIQDERSGPEFLGYLANTPAPIHTSSTPKER